MGVIFVTAEAYPFMKVGGLGDVAYSLPKSLKQIDVDIRVVMPKYKFPKKIKRRMENCRLYSFYFKIRRSSILFYR